MYILTSHTPATPTQAFHTQLTYTPSPPTHSHIPHPRSPSHLDGLLSQCWDSVGEAGGHMRKDLVIHCGGLEVVYEILQLQRERESPWS